MTATAESSRDDGAPTLVWVLGESLASRRVDVMTDDDDGITSASGFNGSLSLCLAPHYLSVLFFFFFPSSVPLSLSLLCLLLIFFFFFCFTWVMGSLKLLSLLAGWDRDG